MDKDICEKRLMETGLTRPQARMVLFCIQEGVDEKLLNDETAYEILQKTDQMLFAQRKMHEEADQHQTHAFTLYFGLTVLVNTIITALLVTTVVI